MALLNPAFQRRALWIDVARGGAILAMIAYHASFDLMFFGLVDWPVAFHPAWRAFAAAIASTFLFAVGVSLVYAHGAGIRWRAFWRRFAVIALFALLVTVGTVLAMPAPIYFGILHAIALFSLLALPFLRAPVGLTVAVAGLVLLAPAVLTSPALDAPYLYAIGLGTAQPFTFDYEPVFPWFAVTLLGVAAGRLVARPAPGASGYARAGRPLRLLAAAGRNSLAIYVLHQPVLFGLLMLVLYAAGRSAGGG
ncbi:MAG: hypothetical protein AcusKO_38050 [Acuticoccus sp.]